MPPPYATGGTITQVGSTYFHKFTRANFLIGGDTNTKFSSLSAIPSVNYVVVTNGLNGSDGYSGTGIEGGSGGNGGYYIQGTFTSFPDATDITINNIGGYSANIINPTEILYDSNTYTADNRSTAGGTGGSPGSGFTVATVGNNGYQIPGYGYVASGGGGGGGSINPYRSGKNGGLGNASAKGGNGEIKSGGVVTTVAQDGVTSTQIGGGGGGGGATSIIGPLSGDGGDGGVIIYYTIGGGSVCFLEGTPVETDQGEVVINKLDTKVNTINGKRILAVTETPGEKDCLVIIKKDLLGENMPNKDTIISKWHRVFYDEEMEEACRIPDTELVPYNGEILYNVLMDEHETMKVNGLTVETLDPDHKVAKFYRSLL